MASNEENLVDEAVAATADSPVLQFTNDFSAEDKQAVKEYVERNVVDTLEAPVLSVNDLTHIGFVAHGSIKSRAKQTKSAREIIFGIINGTRATRGPIINAVSVKSFLESLPAEEKEDLLKQLIG